jgi:hypothetical protein
MQRKSRRDVLPFSMFRCDMSPPERFLPSDSMIYRSQVLGGGFGVGDRVIVAGREFVNDAV